VLRLATQGWKQHHFRLEIPTHLRRAPIAAKLLVGGSSPVPGITYCFDDITLTPAAEVAAPPAPPPPPPLAGLAFSMDFEPATYHEGDGKRVRSVCMCSMCMCSVCVLAAGRTRNDGGVAASLLLSLLCPRPFLCWHGARLLLLGSAGPMGNADTQPRRGTRLGQAPR
jgi:hypothetical protein